MIPFMGCMSARSRGQSKTSSGTSGSSGNSSYHAWDVILKYYQMKGGPEYNAAPARYGFTLNANNNNVLVTKEKFRIKY